MSINTCIICEKQFNAKRKDVLCCSKSCNNQHKKNSYHLRLYDKPCIVCGTISKLKIHEVNCSNCKGMRSSCDYNQIEQHLCCRQCGEILDTRFKNKTRNIPTKMYDKTCDKCKMKNNDVRSEYMKSHNPAFNIDKEVLSLRIKNKWKDPEFREKMVAKFKAAGLRKVGKPSNLSKEDRDRASIRMKKYNPMFNPDAVRKNVVTKRNNGVYENYKRGSEHHRWKGNTNRCSLIRVRINKSWTQPILNRDNYQCVLCGVKHCRLEVHHLSKTFKELISENLNGLHINELNDDEFDKFSLLIEELHNNIEGITVCVPCHKKIDDQRR